MSQPLKGVSITVDVDQVYEQVRGFGLVSGNSPKLAELVPSQAMLSGPDVNVANSAAIEPVLARDALCPGNLEEKKQRLVVLHTLHTAMSWENLGSGSPTDNQPHEHDAEPLPAPCERDMAQHAPYIMFIDFSASRSSVSWEYQNQSVLHDHNHALGVGSSAFPAQLLPVGGPQTQTPEMLSRFLRVDRLNDSLRYEASIAISEGRVQEGEDILKRKMLEEDWQWDLASLASTVVPDLSQWSHGIENGGMEDDCICEGQLEDD